MVCRLLLIFLAGFLFLPSVKAQNANLEAGNTILLPGGRVRKSNPYSRPELAVLGTASFIWAHTQDVRQLASSHPIGFLVEYYPASWSQAHDAYLYRYFRLGIVSGLWDFRQGTVLGKAIPLAFVLTNNLFTSRNGGGLGYRFSAGIAYMTQSFSYPDNPHNTAIGQRLNFAGQLSLTYKVCRSYGYARLEAGLSHFSAGAVLMPNLGLNLPYAGVTLGKELNVISRRTIIDSTTDFHAAPRLPKNSIWVLGAGGAKQAAYSYDPIRFCGTGRVEVLHRFGYRSAVSGGVDVMYNGALRDKRANLGLQPGSVVRVGVTVGHEWLINTFAVSTQVGAYVYNPATQIDYPVYQRYGVRFNLNKRLQPAIFLRAHLGAADCLEAALAYRLSSL